MIDPRILSAITITLILLAVKLSELTPSLALVMLSIVLIVVFLTSRIIKNMTLLFDMLVLAVLIIISINLLDVPSTIAVILMYIAVQIMETTQGTTTSRPIEASILLTTALILLKYSKRQILIVVVLILLPYITNIIRRNTEDNENNDRVRMIFNIVTKLYNSFNN